MYLDYIQKLDINCNTFYQISNEEEVQKLQNVIIQKGEWANYSLLDEKNNLRYYFISNKEEWNRSDKNYILEKARSKEQKQHNKLILI